MSNWEAVAKESEEVLAKPDIKGCHEILTKAYEGGLQHPEILWRLGRSCYEMAEETSNEEEKEKYLVQGLELCQRSVAEDANNFASQKWLGILLSKQKVSTKQKIANAYVIRDHFLKAIELNPNDATSLHCMGSWCYSILQIGWLERKAAALVLGEPPSSSAEECLKYLLRSAEAGNTIHNATLIGDVYQQEGKKKEAKEWYEKAVALPVSSELQKRNHADAAKKLSKC